MRLPSRYLSSIIICLVLTITACGNEGRTTKFEDAPDPGEVSDEPFHSDSPKTELGLSQNDKGQMEQSSDTGITPSNGGDGRFIIQLREEPLVRFKAGLEEEGRLDYSEELDLQMARIREGHQMFETSITKFDGARILRWFTHSINAIVLEASYAKIAEMCRLPQVLHCEPVRKAIIEDGTDAGYLPEDLNKNIEYLGVDDVWAMGSDGEGIVVGVIDSGAIDASHPDFNCPGQDCNVLMNVISDQSMEICEESGICQKKISNHATSVAGIIAANGKKKGIAPSANLIGFGVNGSDEFIDAIEKILSDGNLPKIDVVNISLQFGDGSPDDAVSYAVESLAKAGIVTVISAGNEGKYGDFSIRTPASARGILSVGDVYENNIAAGSSRGPNLKDFVIKPELSAPGTNTLSTDTKGKYSGFSGTSAAAPHVAGAAALIKELHPDWSPNFVKAALMETAEILPDEGIFEQGSGRIDIAKAAKTKTIILPPQLGTVVLDPVHKSTVCRLGCLRKTAREKWEYKQSISILNLGDSAIKYTYSVSPNPPPGVDVAIKEKSWTIDGGTKKILDVTITIDISKASLAKTAYNGSCEGFIHILPDKGPGLHIPYVVIVSPVMEILIEGSGPQNNFISFHDGNSFSKTFSSYSDKTLAIPLSPGAYDIAAINGYNASNTSVIIREGVGLTWGGSALEMNFDNEQFYEIKLALKDHLGAFLTPADMIMGVHHPKSDWRIRKDVVHPSIQKIRVSSTSPDYHFEFAAHALTDDGAYHFMTFGTEGISEDTEFTNTPGDFIHLVQHFDAAENVPAISVFDFLSDGRRALVNECGSPSTLKNGLNKNEVNWEKYKLAGPQFSRDIYIMPPPTEDFEWRYFYSVGYNALSQKDFPGEYTNLPGAAEQLFRTSLMTLSEDGTKLNGHGADTIDHKWPNQIFSLSADDFTLGLTPIFFAQMAFVAPEGIVWLSSVGGGSMGAYIGQTGDEWGEPIFDLNQKTVYKDGYSDGSSVLNYDLHYLYSSYDDRDIPFLLWIYDWDSSKPSPEKRILFLKSGDYPLGGGFGNALTTLSFDIGEGQPDHSPPYFRGLLITEGGVPTNHFHAGEDVERSVKFSIFDASDLPIDSVADIQKIEEFLKGIKNTDSLISLPQEVSADIGWRIPANCSDKSESPAFGSLSGDGTGVMYINKYFECDVIWEPLEVVSIEDAPYNYEASIPSDLAPNEYYLRITAKDAAGNSISYRLKPAFTYGQFEDDYDGDDIENLGDNCAFIENADQTDTDGDGWGEACDNCLDKKNGDQYDTDRDGLGDECDDDADGDDVINTKDNCPWIPNSAQINLDGDKYGDACDNCPSKPTDYNGNIDYDGDGFGKGCDNCPFNVFNPNQADSDSDSVGDECDGI